MKKKSIIDHVLIKTFLLILFLSVSSFSFAEIYPSKPIKLVVPFPPGGVADLIARPLAEKLSISFGQSVVIDNRGGATGTIGASMVANSPPDGYTLLLGTSNEITMSPALFKSLPYDPNTAFTPITPVADFPNVLVVGSKISSKNHSDFIDLIRNQPGKVSFASSGTGSTNHLTAVLYAQQIQGEIVHVPYRGGGPALADLIGGQVDAMFATLPSAITLIKAGKLRALAVTGSIRSPVLPEIPTLKEYGVIGVEVTTWNGILAPQKLPLPLIKQLHEGILQVIQDPTFIEKMRAVGVETVSSSQENFKKRIQLEYENWSKLIKQSRISAD
jgi:tripartite-type tricarboxylate transporter receptor subunit TctC